MNTEKPHGDKKRSLRLTAHLKEQINKDQYWNAIVTLTELQQECQRLFDDILKGRAQ